MYIISCLKNIILHLLFLILRYIFFQLLFLLWCLIPKKKNGSAVIYENYIRPTFLNHEETVDNILRSVEKLTGRLSVQ